LGSTIYDLRVTIGPGVRKETYIKYGEKLEYFVNNITDKQEWREFMVDRGEGKMGLDLAGYVCKQAMMKGVKKENIEVSPVDTIADNNYFSHYRAGMGGENEGRFATAVMIRK
jgi:copper oxidase (laccase) domain-containing protein